MFREYLDSKSVEQLINPRKRCDAKNDIHCKGLIAWIKTPGVVLKTLVVFQKSFSSVHLTRTHASQGGTIAVFGCLRGAHPKRVSEEAKYGRKVRLKSSYQRIVRSLLVSNDVRSSCILFDAPTLYTPCCKWTNRRSAIGASKIQNMVCNERLNSFLLFSPR